MRYESSIKQSPKSSFELTQHNDRRIDNYYWIRDDERNDPEVIEYLESENAYADAWFKSKHDYKSEIVTELIAQVPDEEISFPFKMEILNISEKFKRMISFQNILEQMQLIKL